MIYLNMILSTIIIALVPILTFILILKLKEKHNELNYFYPLLLVGIALAAEAFRTTTVIILLLEIEAIESYQAAWVRDIFLVLGLITLLNVKKNKETDRTKRSTE